MKKKNIIIGLGATALALGGVAVAINLQLSHSEPLQVCAESGDVWGLIGSFEGNNWASDITTSKVEDGKAVLIYTIPAGTQFKLRKGGNYDTEINAYDAGVYYSDWFKNTNGNFEVLPGKSGKYTFTISDSTNKLSKIEYEANESYTVNFDYGYKAGLDGTNYSSSKVVFQGDAIAAPTNIWRVGYRLDGWLKDGEKFNIEDPLHENVNLVANWIKDESVTGEVGFWITNLNNRVPNTLYSWEEGKDGPIGFPGLPVEVSLSTFSPTMKFSGFEKDKDWVHQLYVISYPKSMDLDCAILANAHTGTGVAWQTVDIDRDGTLAALDMGSNDETGHVKVDARHDVYDALDFLKQAEQARNAVKDKAGYRNYSICGIEPATAKALVAKYDALSKASDGDSNWYAKEYVDATTVWTYSSDSDNEDNIRYGDIVGGLRLLAAKDTLPTLNVDVSNSNVTAAVITFATLGVGMAGVAAYIFTRKKKKFDD